MDKVLRKQKAKSLVKETESPRRLSRGEETDELVGVCLQETRSPGREFSGQDACESVTEMRQGPNVKGFLCVMPVGGGRWENQKSFKVRDPITRFMC